MLKKKIPAVSLITASAMLVGTIPAFILTGIFVIYVLIVWAVCIGLLFLCEWLIGKLKIRFAPNLGAFAATAIMGITLISWLAIEADAHTGGKIDPFISIEQQLYLISFLPMIIVSFCANVGNIIYKIMRGAE